MDVLAWLQHLNTVLVDDVSNPCLHLLCYLNVWHVIISEMLLGVHGLTCSSISFPFSMLAPWSCIVKIIVRITSMVLLKLNLVLLAQSTYKST